MLLNRRKFSAVIGLSVAGLIMPFGVQAQTAPNAWTLFATAKFEPKYDEKAQEYLLLPNFSQALKAAEGKDIVLEGYYVPFAPDGESYVILSKYPMSQCYFCGGGGPESIAEVNFVKPPSRFQVDDMVTVKGKLKLNATDLNHINFIITNAEILKR